MNENVRSKHRLRATSVLGALEEHFHCSGDIAAVAPHQSGLAAVAHCASWPATDAVEAEAPAGPEIWIRIFCQAQGQTCCPNELWASAGVPAWRDRLTIRSPQTCLRCGGIYHAIPRAQARSAAAGLTESQGSWSEFSKDLRSDNGVSDLRLIEKKTANSGESYQEY